MTRRRKLLRYGIKFGRTHLGCTVITTGYVVEGTYFLCLSSAVQSSGLTNSEISSDSRDTIAGVRASNGA